jgi:hypothetical protein
MEFHEQEGQFCEGLLWTCPSFNPAKLVDSKDIIDVTDEDNAVDVAPAGQPASSIKKKMEGKGINNTWVVSWEETWQDLPMELKQ